MTCGSEWRPNGWFSSFVEFVNHGSGASMHVLDINGHPSQIL